MSSRRSTVSASQKHTLLIEAAINRAIADGFAPYTDETAEAANLATTEVSRRLSINPTEIILLIAEGTVKQDATLFREEDPHSDFRRSMVNAGVEMTGDKGVRHKILALSDEVKKLQKGLRHADREEITEEFVREKIFGLKNTPPQIPTSLAAPKEAKKDGCPGIPMCILSDVHYAEVLDKEEMGGYNTYDFKTADARIKTFGQKVINAAHYYNPKMDYPGLVVALAGDIFSGKGLHVETDQTNEAEIIDAFSLLQGQMISLFRNFADAFDGPVFVPCVVGNHGRNTTKPQNKRVVATNYEYLFYNQLELFFANDLNYRNKVIFAIPREIGIHFTIGANPKKNLPGHRYYLTHGDRMGAKGGRGIIGVIGPIVRGAHNMQRIEAKRGRPFDTLLIGHYHDYNILPGVICNGTVKGIDEYALHVIGATPKPPSQAFWFNHWRYAPVIHHQIILDTPGNGSNTDIAFPPKRPASKGTPLISSPPFAKAA